MVNITAKFDWHNLSYSGIKDEGWGKEVETTCFYGYKLYL